VITGIDDDDDDDDECINIIENVCNLEIAIYCCSLLPNIS
jgi:hypothetical protein